MSFPAPIDPQNVFLFVDQFPALLSSGDSGMTQFFNFCSAQTINELSTYDILSVLPSQQTLVSKFIYSAKTRYNVSDVGGSINPYNWTPIPEGTKYLQLIISYNNSQPTNNSKYNRVTVENEFWNLETSLNPLKNTVGFTITTFAGSATASILGGTATNIFSPGNMVKVLGTYRQVISVTVNTITVDRPFTVSSSNVTFEIRDNLVNETYAIDFETYLLRLKNIRTLALANNLKVDAYLARKVTQSEFLKIVPFLDKILIDFDYDQNNYTLYNDPTQINKMRDVLLRCTQIRSGTVSINSGSNILFGTGTDFLNQIGGNSRIVVNNQILTVQSITNATQAVLSQTATANTTSATYRTYVEFLPIMYMNKTLRKTWMTTPAFTKSYVDVYKFFTLSGYTLGGSFQSGDVPVSYNLEYDSSITAATLNSGIAIFDRTESIGLNIANATTTKTFLAPNIPYQLIISTVNPTCANASNGVITVQNAVGTTPPYTYNFSGSNNNIITINSSNISYSFSGLTSGLWSITTSDSGGQTSTPTIVTLTETFLPTLSANYVNASYGSITVNVLGGYNNYYVGTIDNNNNYDGNFFVSNLTNNTYTYGAPSTNNFVAGNSYNFIVGDTDGCIKIFQNITIPTASSGINITVTSTNPTCTIADNGTISVSVAGVSVTYPLYFRYVGPNGTVIQQINSGLNNSLTTAEPGSWTVTVYDSTLTLSAQTTLTLTSTFNPTVSSVVTNQICFNLAGGTAPYTITSNPAIGSISNPYQAGNRCISNIPGGTYVFTITDANGCTTNFTNAIASATVNLLLSSYTNPSCDAAANGTATVVSTSSNPGTIVYSATNGNTIYSNTTGIFTGLTSDNWIFTANQGIITTPTVSQTLVDLFNVNIVGVTGKTICISASGGSTGYYTVDINGTLHTYNTATTINCYTGVCGTNSIRVVDGDIINTTLSACVYTTIVNGTCSFGYSVSATTATCDNGNGSILVTITGGTPPFNYLITNGNQSISNTTGLFPSIPNDIWTIHVEDSVGNTGNTIVNLDSSLIFSATTTLTGVCVNISKGLPPYYIFLDDDVYTASTAGNYCYSANCGYHGVTVIDSCPNSYCVRTNIQMPLGYPSTILVYESCTSGTTVVEIPKNVIGVYYETEICNILGSISPKGLGSLTIKTILGLCDEPIDGNCYVDNGQLVEIICSNLNDPLTLTINNYVGPFCSNSYEGYISAIASGGVHPYVSFTATNQTSTYIYPVLNPNQTSLNISGIEEGIWTVYVRDTAGTITSATVNLTPQIENYINISYSATGLNQVDVTVNVNSTTITGWDPPYLFSVPSIGFSGIIDTDITEYTFSLSGIQTCNISYNICPATYSGLQIIHNFSGGTIDGRYPYGSLIQASNGILYGMTREKGLYDLGVIFSCTTSGNYGIIHNFNIINGGEPKGSLIQGNNGILYGMTEQGGLYNFGVIFSCTTSGNYGVIHNFSGLTIDGSFPYTDLIQASNGLLYGTTYGDGLYHRGVIFTCTTSGNYGVIHNLLSGQGPNTLLQATNGSLYGTTIYGGLYGTQSGHGTIFSCSTTGNFSVLYNFSGSSNNQSPLSTPRDGRNPYSALIQASNGLLYGTTLYDGLNIPNTGGGIIFSYSTSGNYQILKRFSGGTIDGRYPYGSLLEASNGLLYGMTNAGGLYGNFYGGFGTIFNYSLSGNYQIIHNFDGTTVGGRNPRGSLIEANDGYLYGMTILGGLYSGGTIFRIPLTPTSNYEVLTSCCYESTIDISPLFTPVVNIKYSGLGITNICVTIPSNAFHQPPYEFTVQGNAYNILETNVEYCFPITGCGIINYTVFRNNSPLLAQIIYSFSGGTDAKNPKLPLALGSDGYIYGTTSIGGTNNLGTIFRINPSNNQYNLIYSFLGGVSGDSPTSGVIMATDGNLYGATVGGGLGNRGIFYRYNLTNNTLQIIRHFNYPPGTDVATRPYSGLIQANSTTKLYGMAQQTPRGWGYYYDFATGAGTPSYTLFGFTGATAPSPFNPFNSQLIWGGAPQSSLLQASDGNLYGITTYEGANGNGTFFKYNISTSAATYLFSFSGSVTGYIPVATGSDFNDVKLIQPSGTTIIFGNTNYGGDNGYGTIYGYNFNTSTVTIYHNFVYDYGRCFGSMFLASNNKLYGGINQIGVFDGIFEFDPSTSGVTIIYDFVNDNIIRPSGQFVQFGDNLYGTSSAGGDFGYGTIYTFPFKQSVPIGSAGCLYSGSVSANSVIENNVSITPYLNPNPSVCISITGTNDTPLIGYEITIDGNTQIYDPSVDPLCIPVNGCDSTNVTICSFIESGQIQNVGSFPNLDFPQAAIMQANDGFFYGVTKQGGLGFGSIFIADTLGNINDIYSFLISDGQNPVAPLIQAPDGILYGTTEFGGSGAGLGGVLFGFNLSTYIYTQIHDFGSFPGDGEAPGSALTLASDGLLYGITKAGGANGLGIIFSLDTSTYTYNIICDVPINGGPTYGALLETSPNIFYATMYTGGLNGLGGIFSCDTSGNYGVVANFTTTSPNSQSSLIIATNGLMYGTSIYGGTYNKGTIFSCNTLGNYGVIHSFDGVNGAYPEGSLIQSSSTGKLYGMCYYGDATPGDFGLVFSIDLNGNYQPMEFFNITNGANPQLNSFIEALDGQLYGTTPFGGINSHGNIFKLILSSTTICCYSATTNFYDNIDVYSDVVNGQSSVCISYTGSLYQDYYVINVEGQNYIFDGTQNPYCIPLTGSCNSTTSVDVSFDTGQYQYQTIIRFSGVSYNDGGGIWGSVIFANNGLIYGMTRNGGLGSNKGTIFTSTTSGEHGIIYNFSGPPIDGQYPYGGLIQANNGILYGVTSGGGSNSPITTGVIFSCSTSGNYGVIYNFGSFVDDGSQPYGSLVQATNNVLYGTTLYGGLNGYGTIFSCSTSGNYGIIHHFDGFDGSRPYGTLIQASNGVLYGTTFEGGVNVFNLGIGGVIFSCTTSGNYGIVYDFSINPVQDGYTIFGGVIERSSNGYLYGSNTQGGLGGVNGVLFKIKKDGTDFTIIHQFNSTINIAGYDSKSQLVEHSDGNLYGLVSAGGEFAFYGAIYKIDLNDNYTYLHSFSGASYYDGSTPYFTRFFEGPDGSLYGTCSDGGIGSDNTQSLYGTVFKFDPINCSFTENITIPCINLNITGVTVFQPFCCDGGSIAITKIVGGTPPYTYTIYNLPTTQTYTNSTGIFTNITPSVGNWVAQVTDSAGQIDTYQFTLTSTFYADINFIGSNAIVSFSGAEQTRVTVNGINYLFGDTLSSTITATYPLTCGIINNIVVRGVEDASVIPPKYCYYSATTFFPCDLTCGVITTNTRCPDGTNGSIKVNVTGGTPNYTYTITNGVVTYNATTSSNSILFDGTNISTPIPAGTWTITVTDANGDSCTQTVNIDSTFRATFTATTTGACFTVVGGIQPYTLLINNVLYTAIAPPTGQFSDGTYCVPLSCGTNTLFISEGVFAPIPCSASFTANTLCSPLSCQIISTNPGCDINGNPNCSGTITINVTGGTPNYTYTLLGSTGKSIQFVGSNTSYTFYNLCSGTYTATTTDSQGSLCSNFISLEPDYEISVTASSITSSCTIGNICLNIAGGTPPYDIYIDNTIRLSATSILNHCFTATCGTNHTYQVIDSTPPCTKYVNQELFQNRGFDTNTIWTASSIVTSCLGYSGGTSIQNGVFIFTGSTSGNTGCYQAVNVSQPYTSVNPTSTILNSTYSWSVTFEDVKDKVYVNFNFYGPFGGFTPSAIPPFGTLTNNTYSGIETIPYSLIPGNATGFGFFNSMGYNGTIGTSNVDFVSLVLLNYTIDCRCSISGTTFVPCNPIFTLNLDSYINPSCVGVCDGSITVSATGGVGPYTYSATNGTLLYVNNTGLFEGLCEDSWSVSASNTCGTITGLTQPVVLNNSFYANILTLPTEFCVTVSGGTPPYIIYINSVPTTTIPQSGTYCYPTQCGVTSIITVSDSS